MIYVIEAVYLPIAIQNGGTLIIISADSTKALIRTNNINGLNDISQIEESSLQTLLASSFWKQPCISCGDV